MLNPLNEIKIMKTLKLFSTAALALLMAACSNDIQQPSQQQQGSMPFTATLAAPGSDAATRTVYTESESDGKISVAWKVDDQIALVHNGVKDVATVKAVDATTGVATIEGTITGSPADNDAVVLVYPADVVSGINESSPVYDFSKWKTQDGTKEYIATNIDFRQGSGQLTVSGAVASLKNNVSMPSGIAIWKLTLQDDATPAAALNATSLSVKFGDNAPMAVAKSDGKSAYYLGMLPVAMGEGALTIEATVGSDTYSYTKAEGITLLSGKYYQNTVTMTKQTTIDLSTVTGDITVEDGYTLTGTLAGKYKVSIADGATVILGGVAINGTTGRSYNWAGITCVGDATIILKDGSENTVKGFNSEYSGIFVPKDKTLTIKGETEGTGKLIASSNGHGAGIGGGDGISSTAKNCGNIVILGGDITATGGSNSAGIGSGGYGSCGDITISGGTVTATGGDMSAAIGSGYGSASCGDITITDGVTSVTATKGSYSPNSIGAGDYGSTCGTVTIGGKVGVITVSPYTYPAPAVGDVSVDPFANGGDPIATPQ
jgi:hypothetical protein